MYLLIVFQFLMSGVPTQPSVVQTYTSLAACEKFLVSFAKAKYNAEAMTTQLGRVTVIRSDTEGEVWVTCAKDERGDKV
tara:strand:+ start:148 stop:384 length:237 start_codon:yes stop_codon:yes gene_type:complete